MKLSWFSPLPSDHTEIANVTARMMPALAREFDLTVYTERETVEEGLGSICPVKSFRANAIDWKTLSDDGLPVYHIGNNIHYHGDIIQTALKCPGIVVLHDLRLHETIMNLCLYKGSGRSGYFEILNKFGGPEAVAVGKKYLDEHQPEMVTIAEMYPIFEYVLENAAGVMTYNPLNIQAIREATPAPVLYSPLPFLEQDALHPEIHRGIKSRYQILIFGFLGGPNRRLRPFLEAYARCSARNGFNIVLAGMYPEEDILNWIQELGLTEHVSLRGFLADEDLDQLLIESDLTINLRWPSMGESSATLLRVWNYSLPAMVTNTSYYSTIPQDTVALVEPENEEEDIQRHLVAFLEDPKPYFQSGLNGHKHLAEHHTIEASIEHLKNFIPTVMDWKGNVHSQRFGRKLARDFLTDYPVEEVKKALTHRCSQELSSWS